MGLIRLQKMQTNRIPAKYKNKTKICDVLKFITERFPNPFFVNDTCLSSTKSPYFLFQRDVTDCRRRRWKEILLLGTRSEWVLGVPSVSVSRVFRCELITHVCNSNSYLVSFILLKIVVICGLGCFRFSIYRF